MPVSYLIPKPPGMPVVQWIGTNTAEVAAAIAGHCRFRDNGDGTGQLLVGPNGDYGRHVVRTGDYIALNGTRIVTAAEAARWQSVPSATGWNFTIV